jgi:hypothetical protein
MSSAISIAEQSRGQRRNNAQGSLTMKSALFGVAVLLLGTSALAQNVSDHNFRLVPEIVPESKPTVETKELTEDPHDCPRATAMENRMACSEGPQLGEPTRTSYACFVADCLPHRCVVASLSG